MLGIVIQKRVRKVEHADHALVGDAVVDGAVLTSRLDEAAPAQTGEVVRDLRLWQAEPLDQLTNREFPLVTKQLENPDARLVAQPAEVLRDQIATSRGVGKTKG